MGNNIGRVFFTSDWHLFHINILKYCNRPFKNVSRMNYRILSNYFDAIRNNDTVFFLGDLFMSRSKKVQEKIPEIFSTLPGNKHLIIGNHDKKSKKFYKEECGFLSVNKKITTSEYCLSHRPDDFIATDLNKILLFGHIHAKTPWEINRKSHIKKCRKYEVGVDANNFAPISLENIKKALDKNPERCYTYKNEETVL